MATDRDDARKALVAALDEADVNDEHPGSPWRLLWRAADAYLRATEGDTIAVALQEVIGSANAHMRAVEAAREVLMRADDGEPAAPSPEVAKALRAVLVERGDVLPETVAEVAASEHLFKDGEPLPERLRDPEAVLHRPQSTADYIGELRAKAGVPWWQVDTYDRCSSVPREAIDELRKLIAALDDKDKETKQ